MSREDDGIHIGSPFIISTSMEDYKNEDWVSLYQSALIELEQAKMSGRIEAAHTAIVARMEKLTALPGLHPEERQAIEDALRSLRFLAREQSRLDVESERSAVERTLEQIRLLDPAIKRLKYSPDPSEEADRPSHKKTDGF